MAVLPMFPLGSVLVPSAMLPLHVFEPRYRQLVIDVLADDTRPPEFGVTLIERGFEVGGGDQRADVGTTARLVQVDALGDGRYALVTVGVRRIRVTNWLDDDPYPRADVEEWPDDELDDAGRVELAARLERVGARLRDVFALAVAGGSLPAAPEVQLGDDPELATHQLVAQSPIGPADRFRALCARSALDRLDVLAECLDDTEAILRFQQG